MSNAKQETTMNEANHNEEVKKNRSKKKKRFMDYAIWVDFPVNAAILTYIVIRFIQALQQGFDVAMLKLEAGVDITGNSVLDELIMACLPVMTVYIAVAVVVEIIYLILKLCRKEPFITEKYAIIVLIGKILWVIYFIATAALVLL